MQAIQQNVFAGDQSMYASSIPHTQPQNLPRFESIPKLSMTPDTEFADVILNQIGFCENSENRRTVAENTQPENLPDDDVEHGGIISDLDLNQISMTDSDIIRFMQNTIPMETAQSMEENMSDSLSQLRIQRSPWKVTIISSFFFLIFVLLFFLLNIAHFYFLYVICYCIRNEK